MKSLIWIVLSELTRAEYKASIDTSAAHVWGRRAWQLYLLQKICAIGGEIFPLFWKGSFNILMIQEVYWWDTIFVAEQTYFSNLKSQIHSQLFPFSMRWLTPLNCSCSCLFPLLDYRLPLGGLFTFTFPSAYHTSEWTYRCLLNEHI